MQNNTLKKKRITLYLIKSFPVILIIPALLPLAILIVIPGIQTLYSSFQRLTFGLPQEFIGLDNYLAIIKDPLFLRSLKNTIIFSFSVVAGEISLGLFAAVLMTTRFKLKKMYISLIMIPYAVSEIVAVIIWKYMLDPDVGIINFIIHTLLGFSQIEWASHANQAWVVIVLLRVWTDFPFSFLIIYSSLIGISEVLYEASYIDGATNWQSFCYVTFPLATPAIMVATIFNFIFAFRNFAIVWILTGGGPMNRTELLSTLLYRYGFSFWEFGLASAIAIVITVITFSISIYYLRNMYKGMFLKTSN